MRCPGIEPGPSAWKADILTTRPTTLPEAKSIYKGTTNMHTHTKAQQKRYRITNGEPGHRSQCLSHAKRALYHLS